MFVYPNFQASCVKPFKLFSVSKCGLSSHLKSSFQTISIQVPCAELSVAGWWLLPAGDAFCPLVGKNCSSSCEHTSTHTRTQPLINRSTQRLDCIGQSFWACFNKYLTLISYWQWPHVAQWCCFIFILYTRETQYEVHPHILIRSNAGSPDLNNMHRTVPAAHRFPAADVTVTNDVTTVTSSPSLPVNAWHFDRQPGLRPCLIVPACLPVTNPSLPLHFCAFCHTCFLSALDFSSPGHFEMPCVFSSLYCRRVICPPNRKSGNGLL